MNYTSSRGGGKIVSGAEAIRIGIAADGGLFVPMELPRLEVGLFLKLNTYAKLSSFILASLLPVYAGQELNDCTALAYSEKKFDSPVVAPLISVGPRQVLELWHGPTSAFKDLALQIMPCCCRWRYRKLKNLPIC